MWATNQITSLFSSIGIEQKKPEELAHAETVPAAAIEAAIVEDGANGAEAAAAAAVGVALAADGNDGGADL